MLNSVKFTACLCVIAIVFELQRNSPAAKSPQPAASSDGESIPEKEQPFWNAAQAFADAYARRDSKAIGQLFTVDAEFYDEFGELTVGREAIVELFQEVFDVSPEATVDEIAIERIRFINDTVALEEGRVATGESESGPRNVTRYIALHVKGRDGKWRINTLKDYSKVKGTANEHLQTLAWLVGEWVSEDTEALVHTEVRWSDDGNYLLRRFTVKRQGERVMDGVQRIGWDPIRQEIRSWTFDSQGGYVAGRWKRSGDQWLVVSDGFNAQGESASGLAIYRIHDRERISWQYRNLVIGSELREDIDPIIMVRRPPAVSGD